MKKENKNKDSVMTDFDKSLGKRLRLYRTMCGLSQAQLGNQLGISPQQIQKYEAATNRISVSRLIAISETLCVPFGDFLSKDIASERINLEGYTRKQHAQQVDLLENYLKIPKDTTRQLISQITRELARLSA